MKILLISLICILSVFSASAEGKSVKAAERRGYDRGVAEFEEFKSSFADGLITASAGVVASTIATFFNDPVVLENATTLTTVSNAIAGAGLLRCALSFRKLSKSESERK